MIRSAMLRVPVSKGASPESCCERPELEVADIFRRYGEQYRSAHKLTPKQQAVMHDIERCRTSHFGYHIDVCDQCEHVDYSYNSCRNRCCPKCQGISKQKWVAARVSDLLSVHYYHTTFTLPHMINPLVPFNKALLYEFIFDAASRTLLAFGRDPRWLGAMIGFYGILHSWGGKLWHHPHIHFIVPAGGVDDEGKWVEPKYQGRFIFPVHAVSRVFRGKFIELFKKAYYQGQIVLPKGHEHLSDPARFESYVNALVGRDWNVNIKRPFANPERVVRYIGRYTHKIAISNHRLIKIEKDRVHFKFKNYRNKGRWEHTSLNALDFIGRFLMHVPPEGFHKIRHYGFLANGRCKTMVKKIREQLKQIPMTQPPSRQVQGYKCPKCAKGVMQAHITFTPYFTMIHMGFRARQLMPRHDTS